MAQQEESPAGTCEQENGAEHVGRLAKRRPDLRIVVVNPSPYPAHAIPLRPNVYYVPATMPDTMIATLRLVQLVRAKQKSREILLSVRSAREAISHKRRAGD